MLKHWSETTFGDFILQQECKMMRQAMHVSAAQTIAIIIDAEAADSGVRERFVDLIDKVRAQTHKSTHVVFAEINNDQQAHAQVRPEYLAHLINTETGQHIETASIDWVILSHAVESTSQPRQLLREATRILADGGRMSVFAFSPIHYLERALWRSISKTRPSVKSELTRIRLQDWLKVLNYEVTHANSFIAPLRALSGKYRAQQLAQEHISVSSWLGMVYYVDALKRDIPVTPVRLNLKGKKKMSLSLVSSAQNTLKPSSHQAQLQLVRVSKNSESKQP